MRDLIRASLGLLAAAGSSTGAAAEGEAGATLFKQHCAACHQADGAGIPGIAPPLKGAHWQKLLQERTYLPRVAAFGIAGPIRIGDAAYNSAMPAQSQLTEEQLAGTINFLAAGLNGANLPPGWQRYEAAEVASVRATPHSGNEQRQLRRKILTP